MQDELRGPRLGRRYFGRDLTNIDEPSNLTGTEPSKYSDFAKSGVQTLPFQQVQYRPLTGNKSSVAYQGSYHTRGYGSHIPVQDENPSEYENPFKAKPLGARNVVPGSAYDRQSMPPQLPQWEICDEEEDPYEQPKPRQAPQAHDTTYTPMMIEEAPMGYPQLPGMIRDTDKVFNLSKQMNFPGCDFENFNGIPFSAIWSHLIFKRVTL